VKISVAISVLLLIAAMSSAQEQASVGANKLAGAWRLSWLERPTPDGQVQRIDCSGIFIFTPDGHASVQVMERRPEAQPSSSPQQYSAGGYEASWGTYTVDERAHTFTFHIQGALVRSLIGKDLPRAYQLTGNELIVKSTRPEEHWRVAWQRY